MSPKNPKYHHGDLRRRLIRTAEALIAKQGIDAVTMRELSRRIGVSHTAAYRHFRDKQQLLSAMARNGFMDLDLIFQNIPPDLLEKPLEHILAQGRAYIDFALKNPDRYRMMFGPALFDNRKEPQFNQVVRKTFAHLLRAIEKGQQSGALRAGNPLELASVCWSTIHGFSQMAIDGQLMSTLMNTDGKSTVQDLERLTDLALEALSAGLVPAAENLKMPIKVGAVP